MIEAIEQSPYLPVATVIAIIVTGTILLVRKINKLEADHKCRKS